MITHADRQILIEATRQHRQRLGIRDDRNRLGCLNCVMLIHGENSAMLDISQVHGDGESQPVFIELRELLSPHAVALRVLSQTGLVLLPRDTLAWRTHLAQRLHFIGPARREGQA